MRAASRTVSDYFILSIFTRTSGGIDEGAQVGGIDLRCPKDVDDGNNDRITDKGVSVGIAGVSVAAKDGCLVVDLPVECEVPLAESGWSGEHSADRYFCG